MSKTLIIFLFIFIASVYSIFFIDLYFGILMYIAIFFFNPNTAWWASVLPNLRYCLIIFLLTFIFYIFRYKKYSDNRLFNVPQTKWFISLVIVMSLVSFIALWPENHKYYFVIFLKIMAFIYLMFKIVDTPEKFDKMIASYIFFGFYVAWWSHGYGRHSGGRLGSTIMLSSGGDENYLAAIFTTIIPLLIFYIMKGKRWQKLFSTISIAYIFDGIILANSRGSFLALMISTIYMCYFLLFKKGKSIRFKFKIVIGITACICLFCYLTDDIFINRMVTLTKTLEADRRVEISRTYFWKKAIDMVKDYPLGTGAGGYMFLSPQYLPAEALSGGVDDANRLRAVHSTYFQVLVEYGYLGFIFFIFLIFSNFNVMKKLRRIFINEENHYLYFKSVALEASLISQLVACLFLSSFYFEILYWNIGFIATFANIHLKTNAQQELPQKASQKI